MKKGWKFYIKRIALLLIAPIVILGFVAANYFSKNNVCKGMQVQITNPQPTNFIIEKNIKDAIINSKKLQIGITKIKDINIESLENNIKSIAWVNDANIYIDKSEMLNINITQKIPVLRWINGNNNQSYLDADAKVIPLNNDVSVDVPIVTSNILGATLNDVKLKMQMVALSKFIAKDTFWNGMISQININNKNQFELIPNIGNHIVLFGDTTNMKNKFDRLFVFYKDALPRKGWNKYNKINVMYNGQIIASNIKEKNIEINNVNSLPNTNSINQNVNTLSVSNPTNENKIKKQSPKIISKSNIAIGLLAVPVIHHTKKILTKNKTIHTTVSIKKTVTHSAIPNKKIETHPTKKIEKHIISKHTTAISKTKAPHSNVLQAPAHHTIKKDIKKTITIKPHSTPSPHKKTNTSTNNTNQKKKPKTISN